MLYDKDIREPLCFYLEDRFGRIRIFDEITIKKSRADLVAVLPNTLIGIEIKSNADTYARLKGQTRDYNKFFDYNYIAVGLRHEKHVSEHIPASWGILCIYENNRKIVIEEKRPALQNTKASLSNQLSLLWKRELYDILDRNHLPKYRQKSRQFICTKLMEKLSEDVLKKEFCHQLFERDYTIFEEA